MTQPGRNVLLGPRGGELVLASPLLTRVCPGEAALPSGFVQGRPLRTVARVGRAWEGAAAGPPLRPDSQGFVEELLVEHSQQHLGSGRETWKFWADFAKGHLGFHLANFRLGKASRCCCWWGG